MSEQYYEFCESLWTWAFDNSLKRRISSQLAANFDLEFAPEPYLILGSSQSFHPKQYLHLLLANPGKGLKIQRPEAIRAGEIPDVTERIPYREVAGKIALHYKTYFAQHPSLEPALRRFNKAEQLSAMSGYEGRVFHADTIPWHSHDLPSKNDLPFAIEHCSLTNKYGEHLRSYLADKSVLSIDGMLDTSGAWLQYKAKLMGMDYSNAREVVIKRKDCKVTCAAYVFKADGVTKIQYCVTGNNNLPDQAGLSILADQLVR